MQRTMITIVLIGLYSRRNVQMSGWLWTWAQNYSLKFTDAQHSMRISEEVHKWCLLLQMDLVRVVCLILWCAWSSMTHIQILTKQTSARDYIKGTHHQPSIKITNILPTVHNVKSLQDDLLFRMNSQLSCARQQDWFSPSLLNFSHFSSDSLA